MNRKICRILLLLLLIIPFNVYATVFSDNNEEEGIELVNKILGTGLSATNIEKKGTIYSFSDGLSDFGIDSGIILDTSGVVDCTEQDEDLKKLMDYDYGGHTSSLEFTMTASGTLLNFNYVFISREFDQGPNFNDVFGLFVSVNGSEYENIAKIVRNNGDEVPVNISNLKAGLSGTELIGAPNMDTVYSLFSAKGVTMRDEQSTNGVSNVFNAQKAVSKGDTVKIKFVIADVSDTSVDSFVLIESESLSFEPPKAKLDYEEEKLKGLDPSSTYKIIDGDDTFEITSNEEGKIPLVGKDDNNKEYNFIGKNIQVIKKGVGDIPDSDPQDVEIGDRPKTPNITLLSVTEDSVSVQKIDGYEYSIDGGVTWQDEPTFKGLEPNKEYEIISRYFATDASIHGTNTSKITFKTLEKEDSALDDVINTNVYIELDNDSPIITISKGKIFESVQDDSEIQEALENGDNIDIRFIVNKVTINDDLKEIVSEELEENEGIAFTVDASIKLYINDVYVKDINTSSKKIVFKIEIPEEYRKSNRKFFIIRVHNGESGEELERLEDVDADDSTITVESDKFSDFIVAYEDEKEETVVTEKEESTIVIEIPKEVINNPKTGDNILLSVALLIVSVFTLIGVLIKKKKYGTIE